MKESKRYLSLIILSIIVIVTLSVCPNNCNSHGKCVANNCVCFDNIGIGDGKSYTGSDCSLLKCGEGNPFSLVSSKYPVSSGSYYRPDYRELDEYVESKKRELSIVELQIVKDSKLGNDLIWKVSGVYELMKTMPRMGGIVQCSIVETAKTDRNDEDVEVLGLSADKTTAYVKFENAVGADAKVTCNSVKSKRTTMVYYKTDGTIATAGGSRRRLTGSLTLTWNYYGKIFKELGLLEEVEQKEEPTTTTKPSDIDGGNNESGSDGIDGEGGRRRRRLQDKIYEREGFKFACYTPPKANEAISTITITEYNDVNGTYEEKEGNTNLVFTIDSALKTGDVCYVIMSGDLVPINIEQTELINYVNVDNGGYKLGKYTATGFDSNGYAVIATTDKNCVTGSASVELTIGTDYDKMFGVERDVYVDILSSGKLSEKDGKATYSNEIVSIALTDVTSSDIILPYIKLHSFDPSTNTKPYAKKEEKDIYYTVYNLADKLISQLDKNYGGILTCSYTDEKKNEVLTSVDIKKYEIVQIGQKEVVASSYVQLNKTAFDSIDSLKCDSIALKRRDYTMYNPMKIATDGELTWTGYAKLTKLTADSKVNFACYNGTDGDVITLYDIVSIDLTGTDSVDVKFSISKDGSAEEKMQPKEKDICYLAAKIDNNIVTPISKDGLAKSDLGEYIRKEGENYYYGKYEKPETGIEVKPSTNNLPVFAFDNKDNKIDEKESIIQIVEDDIQNDDLEYFKIGQTILIEVENKDKMLKYNHKAIIVSFESRLLKSDGTRKFKYSPPIPTEYKPTGVLEIASPTSVSNIESDDIDPTSYLYKVTGFYGPLLSELPLLGGKVQCKYVNAAKEPKKGIIGSIDVKTYKDDLSYIQFNYTMTNRPTETPTPSNPTDSTYYLQDMSCDEIISERNDMTFFNPLTLDLKNYENGILTWKGYKAIFEAIGFTVTDSPHVEFACYNPTPSKNNIKVSIYKDVGVGVGGDGSKDIKFTFTGENKPSEGDVCHLLTDSKGKVIDIENSELFELVRKEGDEYYYGKYGNIEADSNEIIKSEDGSITQVLGIELFSTTDDDKDKINIGKLDNDESPSIAYPPSLITDGIKKLIVPGTTMIFKQGSSSISTQIIKVKPTNSNKFEIFLNKRVGISRLRSLFSNSRLLADIPSTPLTIVFENEKSVHSSLECSGQGECDRTTGVCKCFDGFSGSACQRLDCPNNCNGNGRCVALSELLSNDELSNSYEGFGNKHESEYTENGVKKTLTFDDQVYGCLCDKRHRGYDCSLIECPSDKDPEEATNMNGNDEHRDCSGRGICNYNTGVCECFDGFSGEGCQNQVEMM